MKKQKDLRTAMTLSLLRCYYNFVLFLLGWRKVLPAMFITRVPTQECGEKIVSCQGSYVRKTVADLIVRAGRLLPQGYSIKILEGHRSERVQCQRHALLVEKLAVEHPEWTNSQCEQYANRCIANKSGHSTGGAVDVILVGDGNELDCGTAYLEFSCRTPTQAAGLTRTQRKNREMLFKAMTSAGFVNYPLEWWHYCYGDKMYAAYNHKPFAQYGSVELS